MFGDHVNPLQHKQWHTYVKNEKRVYVCSVNFAVFMTWSVGYFVNAKARYLITHTSVTHYYVDC